VTEHRADLHAAMRWALDATSSPGRAATDWLASEIVPGSRDAANAIASTTTSIEQLVSLKVAFKAQRQGGASAAERNRAARLYAATIAAALVRHSIRITRNSDGSLLSAFVALRDDEDVEESLRELGGAAAKLVRAK
jgi:hypothetical protein